jgi:YggT family protein
MMSDGYLLRPLIFLIQAGFGFYIVVVMLRLLLQMVRADFRNPISQFVVKLTAPVLRPLRRVIPAMAGYDTSSLVLAWLLKTVELTIIGGLIGAGANPFGALVWTLPSLVSLTINIFLFAVLIVVILSWVGPRGYNPGIEVLDRLTAPLLEPARRLLPPLGGLDLSPMLVMIGLYLLEMLAVPPLMQLTGAPGWVSAF